MRYRGGIRHLFRSRLIHDSGAVRADRDLRSVHNAHSYRIMEMIINTRPYARFNCETAERILIRFCFLGGGFTSNLES